MRHSLKTKLLTALTTLAVLLGKTLLWLALTGCIAHGIATLEMAHYQPDDTPDERFMVAVIKDGEPYPIYWQAYERQLHTLATTPSPPSHVEDRLYQDTQGNWVYYNEGALWNTQSTYQIHNNTVIPISYRLFTFIHVFYGMIGASVILTVIGYIQRRYRRHADALASQQQQ